MIRTIVGCILILIAVLWLPVWFQLVLFIVGVLILPYRVLLLIPAVIADAIYATTDTFTLAHFKTTCIVIGMLFIWHIIITQTRLTHHYVSHTK